MLPGCLGAARYRVLDGDGSHQYVACTNSRAKQPSGVDCKAHKQRLGTSARYSPAVPRRLFVTAPLVRNWPVTRGRGSDIPFAPRSYRSGVRLALFTVVATHPSRVGARCDDWEALKRALAEQQDIAYEFDARELHVWNGSPERGERCKCGARAWS